MDFFSLFGLPPAFRLDPLALEKTYRDIQSRVHPDRYAHLPETERRLSMQMATQVNEAYRTLRNPLLRARYLLELRGVDLAHETNTAMAPEFLIEQMEWREAVEEARQGNDHHELEKLHLRLRHQADALYREIEDALDDDQQPQRAAENVRRLMFIERLQRDIDEALEALDN